MAFISIGEKPQRGERLQAGVKRSATPDNEHEQTNPDRVKETFLNRRFLFFHAFGVLSKTHDRLCFTQPYRNAKQYIYIFTGQDKLGPYSICYRYRF